MFASSIDANVIRTTGGGPVANGDSPGFKPGSGGLSDLGEDIPRRKIKILSRNKSPWIENVPESVFDTLVSDLLESLFMLGILVTSTMELNL